MVFFIYLYDQCIYSKILYNYKDNLYYIISNKRLYVFRLLEMMGSESTMIFSRIFSRCFRNTLCAFFVLFYYNGTKTRTRFDNAT